MSSQSLYSTLPVPIEQLSSYVKSRIAHLDNALKDHVDVTSILTQRIPHVNKGYSIQHATTRSQNESVNTPQPPTYYIDHTLLRANATSHDITQLYQEAYKYNMASICVNANQVAAAVKAREQTKQIQLQGEHKALPLIAAVCSFPLGASTPPMKAAEATALLYLGVDEIDVVVNIGAVMDNDYVTLWKEMESVMASSRTFSSSTSSSRRIIIKWIFETCLLNATQIIDLCLLAVVTGVHFVKTSTGFSTGGATIEAVRLMKLVVGDACLVKASGGIREAAAARDMLANGASRLGTSAGIAIANASSTTSTSTTSTTSSSTY